MPLNLLSSRNRLFALLALMAGFLAPSTDPDDWNVARPGTQGAVLPDTEGAISEITLHFDPLLNDQLGPAYEDLLHALPPDVRFRVLCPSHEAARQFVDTWGRSGPDREIQVINVSIEVSAWARDRCIARQTPIEGDRAPSFVPVDWERYWDYQASETIAYWILGEAQLDLMPLTTWLRLDGGNVVSNERHAFLTSAVLQHNSLAPRDLILRELERVLGRECIIVQGRTGSYPWDHVDMFLTPLNEYTILVASQELAEQILWDSWPQPSLRVDDEHQLGDFAQDHVVESQLDDVAEGLSAEGYRVLRLPAMFNDSEDWVLTYNNVLMERREGRRIVYLPVYGIPALDRIAEAVYRAEGFEVMTIDVSKIFTQGGAVRCIANVTARRLPSFDPDSLQTHSSPGMQLIDVYANGGPMRPPALSASVGD